MALRTDLLEIKIVFSSGMEHQLKKAGELEGAHMITMEHIVDDAGEIQGTTKNPKNGHAQPLDPQMVQSVLGERFVIFDQQLTAAKKKYEDDLAVATKDYDDRIATMKEQMRAIFEDHKQGAEKISAALAEHNDLAQKISAAMGAISAVGPGRPARPARAG